MADLTRFDFHALRFNKSEQVQGMSASEVGQYILLLVEAWLIGKDASLPDDPQLLARLARVDKVSDRVLNQFPIVSTEFGQRRQNPTLYSEWAIAKERTALASRNGKLGSASRWPTDSQPITTLSSSDSHPKNNFIAQTNPIQPNPDQPTHTKPNEFSGACEFKTIRIRYRAEFGKNQSDSKSCKEEYQKACSKYGEDIVLKYFDEWAPTSKSWIREGYHGNNGLQFFYRKLDEMVEGDELRVAREEDQKKKDGPEIAPDVVNTVMEQDQANRQVQIEADLERIRQDKLLINDEI
jgi:uncharacterized protein YdaU (DUF1376 family)